ncbi:MAG: hypothetical protein JXB62_10750 [Pirellulales bacterium]|nr:hypothetical protein [Pirellulales bacterium]
MMAQFVRAATLILVSLVFAIPAQADWIKDFVHSVVRDTKRRNCWPKPFVCPDYEAVQQPFAIMTENGWRRQNMLGDHHFAPETGKLTEAAGMKIRWILTEAPARYRSIYVHRAETAEATAARIQQVQEYAASIAPDGQVPPVLETGIPAMGWPAERVEAISRKFQQAVPEPVLPASQSARQ